VIDLIATVLTNAAGLDKGTSGWSFSASLQEFDIADINWDTPTTVSQSNVSDVQFETHPVPMLGSYFWQNGGTRFQFSKRIFHDSVSAPEDWQFPHREGQLYDEDKDLIQRQILTVDASGISSNNAQLRLVVSATYNGGSLDGFDGQGFYGTTATTDRIQLTNVGHSITQRRDL
jgi:hypothetical protein